MTERRLLYAAKTIGPRTMHLSPCDVRVELSILFCLSETHHCDHIDAVSCSEHVRTVVCVRVRESAMYCTQGCVVTDRARPVTPH